MRQNKRVCGTTAINTIVSMWFTSVLFVFSVVVFCYNVEAYEIPKSFGCKNSMISDEWRKYVLDYHNTKRKRLANNKQACGNNKMAPFAKNMNELRWNCDIEHHAWTNACGGTIHTDFVKNEATFANKKGCNITTEAKKILDEWWNQVKKVDLDANQNYVADIEQFGLMAAGEAKEFACTYKACPNAKPSLICVYDKKLTVNTDPVYTKAADATQVCTACNSNLKPDCIDSLCQQEYASVRTKLENRACTAKDDMSNDLEAIAVGMHNYYRRLSATGWAVNGKGGYAPTAKNMLSVAYDCTGNIGTETKDMVADCDTKIPTPSAGYAVNYYRVGKHELPEEKIMEMAIQEWAKQVTVKGVGEDNLFHENDGITEYANMVHDKRDKITCAVKVCKPKGASAVACQYNNGLLGDDDVIYEIGTPCRCDGGRKCSPLQGLCVLP
ncbi:hypothetical protein Y032_0048g1641 [Ancylostoma ceylanicum]|nr:hypothetical protein Y032_0048g1641 [Ancylostoma ceylanicum]